MGSYKINNCNFTDNHNSDINTYFSYIENCNFKNNSYFSLRYVNFLINCNFENNTEFAGNAKNNMVNCSLINNNNISFYANFINNSKFINNTVNPYASFGGTLVINCYFENNVAKRYKISSNEYIGGCGGAVRDSGTVINCTFINNQATQGGAIYYVDTVINCSFYNNCANNGGAIYDAQSVINCTFDNNQAKYDGGAISFVKLLEHCIFMNNKVYGDNEYRSMGGIIFIGSWYNATIKNCNFVNNYAGTFGSVIVSSAKTDDEPVEITFINSNFTNNKADGKFSTMGYLFKSWGNGALFSIYDWRNSEIKLNLINCSKLEKNSEAFKLKTKITAAKISMNYKDSKYLTITVQEKSFSRPIKGLKVKIKINDKVYYRYSDENGKIKILIKDLIPKTYTAEISYARDDFTAKSSKNVNIVVKKLTPKLTASAKTFNAKLKTKKYSITLKDNNKKAMKNAKVSLKVNGKTFTAKTNSKGVATFKITKLTKKGSYNAKVAYVGDSYFNKISKSVNIKLK